ncbi:hypothetical protein C1632_15965 [Microbacterium testaceum]|uniref:hypothetical protein n=1 Tax=Microbacterium testaceum TaxID=2033 RepID=UPI000CCDAED9|nr:hypothetical protein [Microbacterium testaceum]PNW07725.1 hypothetical protein C1632_15965 [Microbacterium testaceum]
MLFRPSKEAPPPLPAGVEAGLYKLGLPERPRELVGYLSVRPFYAYEVDGPWWRKRLVRPTLIGDCHVDFVDLDVRRTWPDASHRNDIKEGPVFEAEGFDELDQGRFTLHGVAFSTVKVDPTDSPNEYRAHFRFVDVAR